MATLKTVSTMTEKSPEIYSVFDEKRRVYTIESDYQVFAHCNNIDEMKIVLTCIEFHEFDEIGKVIKWAKQENKRISPLYSDRGMDFCTPAHRFNIVFDCVCNRMQGLRPKHIKKGCYKWVPATTN